MTSLRQLQASSGLSHKSIPELGLRPAIFIFIKFPKNCPVVFQKHISIEKSSKAAQKLKSLHIGYL